MPSITQDLPRLTNLGLIYLWITWTKPMVDSGGRGGRGGFAQVCELYGLSVEQEKLWEDLPESGYGVAKESLDGIQEVIKRILTWYKKSFLEDKPYQERMHFGHEIHLLRTQERMLKDFMETQ